MHGAGARCPFGAPRGDLPRCRANFASISSRPFVGRHALIRLFVHGACAQALAEMASGRGSSSWRTILLTFGLLQHQPVSALHIPYWHISLIAMSSYPPLPPRPHPTQHARTDTTASHIAFYFVCVCGCVFVGLAAAVRVDPDRHWVNSKKDAGRPASSFASSPPPSQPLPPPPLPPRVKGLGLNHDPPPPWPRPSSSPAPQPRTRSAPPPQLHPPRHCGYILTSTLAASASFAPG